MIDRYSVGVGISLLFGVTVFVSALLLFFVQPMFARMVLPLLGGSPSVWNTCILFFQSALLAGYAYVHILTARVDVRRQAATHAFVMVGALLVLPLTARGWAPPGGAYPVPWLLSLMALTVGLPFFALAATAPLVQKWFSMTRHPGAHDPYFLYAASNAGSLLALVAYPLIVEPVLRLPEQSVAWAGAYTLLIALMAACVAVAWRDGAAATAQAPAKRADSVTPRRPSASRRLRWLLLSFVPSSLMLAVTTHLSTDIAAVPLLWIVPLATYLLTFVIAFGSTMAGAHAVAVRAMPILLLPLTMVMIARIGQPLWFVLPLHVLAFAASALVCHGELARDRPEAGRLTEFYLWIASGGALGGIFNTLVAPFLFTGIVEYPIAFILACWLRPPVPTPANENGNQPADPRLTVGRVDVLVALGIGVLTAAAIFGPRTFSANPVVPMVTLAVPALLCFRLSRRPKAFALGIVAMFCAAALAGSPGAALHAERTFFGVYRVQSDPTGRFHELYHGTTLHGRERIGEPRATPLTYYHPAGPIGQVLDAIPPAARQQVAVVGLGIGSLAAYARAGEAWTFYEIDPAVERIARDTRYFTFLRDCRGRCEVRLGDARLSLAKEPAGRFGVIVLDAFSSDAIPVHLLTREAVHVYLDKLSTRGVLAFHISNRHLTLRPVIAGLAREEGLAGIVLLDRPTATEAAMGRDPSEWAILRRTPGEFALIASDPRWKPLELEERVPLWTDDFSNILGLLNIR